MEPWWKPGSAGGPKIRSNANRGLCILLAVWVLVSLACSRTVNLPDGYTATSWALQLTSVAPGAPIASPTPLEGLPILAQPEPTGQLPTPEAILPTQAPQNTAEAPTVEPSATFPVPIETPEVQGGIGGGADEANQVILYYAQAGDTVPVLAYRFDVDPADITSPKTLPLNDLITPNQLLLIPARLETTGPSGQVMPDSEVVYSSSAVNFDTAGFVQEAGGYLNSYKQELSTGMYTGAQVIDRVAIENSVNPRILLSILEYQSHWVYGQPENLVEDDYPIGRIDYRHKGLYQQLSWAVSQLAIGYYGWRGGWVNSLDFPGPTYEDGMRLAPDLNAGTVALQYLFAQLYNQRDWGGVLYNTDSFPALHERMFGNPWMRAQTVEPLYPTNLTQPPRMLPFLPKHTWAFTGGPHSAWGPEGARAAIDFAPGTAEHGCAISNDWITSMSDGLVVRSGNGIVTVDLDGDGYEQTGWVILYLHVRAEDRIPSGTVVAVNDRLGHPSCDGGVATGTHVHIARKFNGEWILADGPVPFNLDGWIVHAGTAPYIGTLTKGDQIKTANTFGSSETQVTRAETTP